MNWSDIATVFRKDWSQSLRDRKTLLIMLIGVLATPIASTAIAVGIRHRVPSAKNAKVSLVVVGEDASWAASALQKIPRVTAFAASPGMTVSDVLPRATAGGAMVLDLPQQFRQRVEGLRQQKSAPTVVLYVDNRRDTVNQQAAMNVALDEWRDVLARERSIREGGTATLSASSLLPKVTVEARSLASNEDRTGTALGIILPMNLALTVLLLSLYSSTELITAERERGTMVLLAVAPVARRDVLIGKILVVLLTAVLGAMLSLGVHFLLTATFVRELADTVGPFPMAIPLGGSLLCVLLTIPLVAFLAAASFMLACSVRNFQQAQSYASVLLIVGLLPALATVVGTKTYPPIVAIVPVANNALAMRDALSGALEPVTALAALVSSSLYAVGAVYVATRLLDSEHAIFPQDEPPDTWRWTARWLVLFLGLVFLAFFIIGQPLQSADTLIGLACSQVFLIGLPVFVFLHWLRLPWRNLLSLRAPRSALVLLGSALLAPLTVLAAWSIGALQEFVLPSPKALNDMMMQILVPHGRPLWLVFAAVAAAPAVCEELLFRGCVQGVLLRVLPPRVVLPITAFGFGLFHMSTFRLLPTSILGFVLCFLTFRFGSIYPSMVLHFFHNGLATWISMRHIDPLDWRNVALALTSGICGILLLRVADLKCKHVPK